MPSCFGQLAGQRLGGDYFVGLTRFAIKPSSTILSPPSMVGCFHKCPSQILIAAFAIVLSLFLAVGTALCSDSPAITGKVFRRGESVDISDFHSNHHS